jgi:dipeptidyl aminopeptidase/acylaminoacyl peptidase
MTLLYRCVLLLVLAAVALPAAAQLPPLIDREVFFGDPEIASAQLSPDGQYLTFRKPYAVGDDEVMNVWVKGSDEPFEDARPLTADERPVPGYFWSEDSRYVLYVQDKGGNENYHVYAVNPSADADPATGVPAARDLTPLEDVRAQIYATPDNAPNEIVVGLNDRDPSWHDVYRINLETGERELLIENTERIAGWEVDLNGNVRLALRTTNDGSTEILRIADDLTIDPDPVYTCTVEESCGTYRYHEDGRRVYMITNKGDRDLTELVLFDPATGEEELVERDPANEADFGGALFSQATDELLATYYVGDRVRIYPQNDEVAADLDFLRRTLPEGEIYPGSMTNDDRLMLVTVTRDVDPGSVYLFNRDTDEVEKLYESRPELPSEHLAEMQAVRYTARDGMEIPAYLTLPKGVESSNLPVVIYPHGGPWARDNYGYDAMAQFLANRGYAVLQPNFRGSTGYGKAFLNAGNREWGTGAMQHDLTDGVQYLVDEGIADGERVAILGGSYGGYAALAGVTFTPDLYAAAVDIVGPSNLITLLESIPPYWEAGRVIFHERMGDPTTPEGREQLEAQSPLNFADRITTPLLVIQGANDPRVKQRESDQIVVALRNRNYPVEYLVAPDEGHGFRGEENRIAMTVAIEDFLAEHLGGRAQEGMAPEIEAKLDAITVDPATVVVTDPMGAEDMDDLAFDGTAVRPAKMSYDIVMTVQGQEVSLENPSREVALVEHDGQPALAIVDRATLPPMMGGVAVVDSFVVARDDFAPLYRKMQQGPGTIVLTYDEKAIGGRMSQGGQTMPFTANLDRPIIADGGALEVSLSALPLEEGYTASFATYSPIPGQQGIQTWTLSVTGTEEVTVPTGTYDTYVVEMDKMDSNEDMTLYLDQETGMLVKSVSALPAQMGGGTVITELNGTEM